MILTVPVLRTCDKLHVNYQFDLPSHDLYLPRAVGQLLMSIPEV